MKIVKTSDLEYTPIEVTRGEVGATEILWAFGRMPEVLKNPIPDSDTIGRKIATAAVFLMIPQVKVWEVE